MPQAVAAETSRPSSVDLFIERALAFMERNPPIFQDDFHDPDSGWEMVDDQHGQRGYKDGAYVVRVPEIVGQENIASIPLPFDKPLSDFILQFDLVTTDGGPGANWAVEFRAQSKTRLYAGLSTHPRGFGIGLFDSGKETALNRGLAPKYGPGDVTRVLLIAAGPNLALYLDGEPIGRAHTEWTRPGRLYFNVINTGDPIVAYRLDNVVMWDLSQLASLPEVSRELQPISEDFEDGLTDNDPDPLPPGAIAFENSDPPARHLIDDVVIEPARP